MPPEGNDILDNIEKSIAATLGDGETLQNDDTTATQDDSNDTTQQAANGAGDEADAPTAPKPDGTRDGKQDASQQPGGKPGTQQPAQQKQDAQRRPHAAQNGDLVDPQTGRVVARAGQERRFYEGMTRERHRASQLESRLQQATQQVEAYKQAATMHTQLGLTPDDVITANQFMAHFKREPLKAAENMLAQLAAAGYDISQLGVGVQVSAIRQMMDERLQPFTQDREAARKEAETRAAVEAEINEVASEFYWFNSNQHVVEKVVAEAPPNITLREVALRVENWAIKEGLDLDGDLEAQYLAKMNGQQQQPATTQQPNRARGSVPSVNGGGNGQQMPRSNASASANRSSRDIVRETMREHGFSVE